MPKTILVVEDSRSVREMVRDFLVSAGYSVLTADNGATALQLLDGRKIHLVVCDVEMPEMDGIEFVSRMKQTASYHITPVIMLTTLWTDELKMQGRNAGAKAWFVKPFDPDKMLAAVTRFILP